MQAHPLRVLALAALLGAATLGAACGGAGGGDSGSGENAGDTGWWYPPAFPSGDEWGIGCEAGPFLNVTFVVVHDSPYALGEIRSERYDLDPRSTLSCLVHVFVPPLQPGRSVEVSARPRAWRGADTNEITTHPLVFYVLDEPRLSQGGLGAWMPWEQDGTFELRAEDFLRGGS